MGNVRVRMAPSPTGEYHIGHIRTTLYNYAFCRQNNGSFVMRVEDTDRQRFVEGAIERILGVIKEYGLDWDEGPKKGGKYGPYVQSQRLDIYKKYAEELIKKGHAYRCFCTKEELEKMRLEQQRKGATKTMYDGTCRKLDQKQVADKTALGLPYVIRHAVPKNEFVEVEDKVYGNLKFDTNEIDDTVLLKSDGFPTYHLGVVIDDYLMKITHIMRGNDWLPSLPKHVLLYKAFGWELPTYIHLPNLKEMGQNRKLSKRFGAVFAVDFLEEGYIPEALLNFLMFLGWNPGTEKEIYTLDEFIKDFSIDRIHKTDLIAFDREKLLWLNGHYLREMSIETLWEKLSMWSQKYNVNLHNAGFSEEYNLKVLAQIQERIKTFSEFVRLTHYFYKAPNVDEELLFNYVESKEKGLNILAGFYNLLSNIKDDTWNAEALEKSCHDFIAMHEYKPKEAFMTLRVALSNEKATPPLFDMLEILGKNEVEKRLNILV